MNLRAATYWSDSEILSLNYIDDRRLRICQSVSKRSIILFDLKSCFSPRKRFQINSLGADRSVEKIRFLKCMIMSYNEDKPNPSKTYTKIDLLRKYCDK